MPAYNFWFGVPESYDLLYKILHIITVSKNLQESFHTRVQAVNEIQTFKLKKSKGHCTHTRTHTHACTHQGHSLNHAHTHTHLQMTHKDPHPPSQMKPSRCPTESAAKLGCSQMGIHQWTPIPGCSLPTMSDLCEKLKQVLNVGR